MVPAGIKLNFMPIELIDSGNFTLPAETAVGGVSAEILPPSAATKATQTTAGLAE